MKIVKISAIWCGACLIMNKVWNNLKEKYDFEDIELDYDMDEEEVAKYNPGDILPVFIVYDGEKELLRMTGEFKVEDIVNKINEVGELREKNS
ncbi:MAG: thioredoxin family protein [Bacilli bacterium]|nr:thioredoxin family protein [Bacilli bacterium]